MNTSINNYLELRNYLCNQVMKRFNNFFQNRYIIKNVQITDTQIFYRVKNRMGFLEISITKHTIEFCFSYRKGIETIFEEINFLFLQIDFENLKSKNLNATIKTLNKIIKPDNFLSYDFSCLPKNIFIDPVRLWFSILIDGYKIESSAVQFGRLEKNLSFNRMLYYIELINKEKEYYYLV